MNTVVETLIEKMLAEVQKHQLELMGRYPDDLLVHDRRTLTEQAVDGATFAWVVGDSHTHLVMVGVHENESDLIWHLGNLSENDHYYRIDIKGESATLKELSVDRFCEMANVRIPYQGRPDWSFSLKKGDSDVGSIKIQVFGNIENRTYKATCTSRSEKAIDRVALKLWAVKAINKLSGSLFWRGEVILEQVSMEAA